jgi:hypothetical protein
MPHLQSRGRRRRDKGTKGEGEEESKTSTRRLHAALPVPHILWSHYLRHKDSTKKLLYFFH